MEERRRDVAQTLSTERIDKLSDWIGTVIGVDGREEMDKAMDKAISHGLGAMMMQDGEVKAVDIMRKEEPEQRLSVSDSPDLNTCPREPARVRPVDALGGWDYILSCLSQVNAQDAGGWVRVTGGSCHGQEHGEVIIRSMTIIEEPAKGVEWHQGMYTWREFIRMLWDSRGDDALKVILRGSPGCGAIRIDGWEMVERPSGYGGVDYDWEEAMAARRMMMRE